MKKIFLLAAVAIAMTACNNDDITNDDPVAAQISATIGAGGTTRASNNSWDIDDKIGITMSGRYFNIEYITKSGDGDFEGSPIYFKNKREPVTLTAYYPFTNIEDESLSEIEGFTTADFQKSAKQRKIDYLFAKKENVTGEQPKVKFEFSHKMSQLTFVFKNGSGADVNQIKTFTIEGLVHAGTFNVADGVCSVKSDAEAENLNIDLTDVKVVSEKEVAPLIVFPQSVADKTVMMKITDSEGQDYACTLSFENNRIEAGNNYKWTIIVNKTSISVEESEINDWSTVEKETGTGSLLPNK